MPAHVGAADPVRDARSHGRRLRNSYGRNNGLVCTVTKMISELRARLDEPTARGLAEAVEPGGRRRRPDPGRQAAPDPPVATGLRPLADHRQRSLAVAAPARHHPDRRPPRHGRRRAPGHRPRAATGRPCRRSSPSTAVFALDLSTGVPDPALLPDLRPALRRASRHGTEQLPRRAGPGRPGSRAARAVAVPGAAPGHLRRRDGRPRPDRLLAAAPGRPRGRREPCFPPLLDLLDALGVRAVGVGLDESGAVPAELAARAEASPGRRVPAAPGPQPDRRVVVDRNGPPNWPPS